MIKMQLPVLGYGEILKSMGIQSHVTASTAEEETHFADVAAGTGDAQRSQLTEVCLTEV